MLIDLLDNLTDAQLAEIVCDKVVKDTNISTANSLPLVKHLITKKLIIVNFPEFEEEIYEYLRTNPSPNSFTRIQQSS